jgi:hypothetical protein
VLSLEKKRSAEQLELVIDDSTLGIARAACWPGAALEQGQTFDRSDAGKTPQSQEKAAFWA